jgi:hypothetical protein
MRPKFRETLWFKKGQLDAEAAQRAATEKESQVVADSLPIEDRYNDDGSLQPRDSVVFGVHTGTTRALVRLEPAPVANSTVAEQHLISEMKTGRRLVLGMIAGAALAIGGIALAML